MTKNGAKITGLTIAAVIGALAVTYVVRIATESEEDRLERAIRKAKRYAERENMAGLTSSISPQYYDDLGNDRRSLLWTAKTLFDSYRNILILIDGMEITVDRKTGNARISATVYWQEGRFSDIFYDTAEFEAGFTKEEGSWKLRKLEFFEPENKKLFSPMTG